MSSKNKLPRKEDVKGIVCDIDGTLLTNCCEVHPKNKEIIKKLRIDYPHVPIILATGRDFNAASFVRQELEIENFPTINVHGAMIHSGNGDLLVEASIPGEIACKILDHFISQDRFLLADLGNNRVVSHSGKGGDIWRKQLEKFKDCFTCKNLHEYDRNMIINGEHKIKRIFLPVFEHQISTTLSDIDKINDGSLAVTRTVGWALEVLPIDFNKGTALSSLCQILGIDVKNFIAFGDAPNDLEMLSTAGFSVAMDNGFSQVKQIAQHITSSNDEGGVGVVLEEIFYKSEDS